MMTSVGFTALAAVATLLTSPAATPAAFPLLHGGTADPGAEPSAKGQSIASAQPIKSEVTANGLVGELYTPAGPQVRYPAVLVLGGSEGGLKGPAYEARELARRGYVALAVAYFGAPGVPDELTNIPLEYFKTALDYLRAQPKVDPDRIGLLGTSKGGEAALVTASRYPQVRAVVAGVPANVAWQGFNRQNYMDRSGSWTLGGKPIAFVPYDLSTPFTSVHDLYQRSLAKVESYPDAIISVERIQGPVMMVCGEADTLWPSCPMSDAVVARLKNKAFRYRVEKLSYPDAGHAAFGPPIPPENPAFAMLKTLGGTQAGNLAARADSWSKAMAFLDRVLKKSPASDPAPRQ